MTRKPNTAVSTVAPSVPRRSAARSAPISTFSPTRTRKQPITEATMPPAMISIGRYQAVWALETSPTAMATVYSVMVAITVST